MKGINPRPGEWDQHTHPYRLSWTVPSSVRGNHGWAHRSLMYRTEQEARDDYPLIPKPRFKNVHIHKVKNPGRGWRWESIATLK